MFLKKRVKNVEEDFTRAKSSSGEDWGEGGQKLAVFSHSFLLHTLKWRQPLAGAWQVLRHLPRFSPQGLLCKRRILKTGNPLFWQLFTGLDLQI